MKLILSTTETSVVVDAAVAEKDNNANFFTSSDNTPIQATNHQRNGFVENELPIIGVLSQEMSRALSKIYPGKIYKSFIAASYVKYVEGGGARVVPIFIDRPKEYYRNIMSKING